MWGDGWRASRAYVFVALACRVMIGAQAVLRGGCHWISPSNVHLRIVMLAK